MSQGYFVLSLDMELMWGVQENKTIKDYGPNVLGVWKVLPRMLDLFVKRDIHCTWAIVGFLFCANKERIYAIMPEKRPRYTNMKQSSYAWLEGIGSDEHDDPYHYAPTLINLIRETPNQEIATHTFSHYYCQAQGQSKEEFRQDILAAIEAAEPFDIKYKSIVFPRNEVNQDYLEVLAENGINVYRGYELNWIRTKAVANRIEIVQRAFRFVDTYLNITGANCHALEDTVKMNNMFDISASRFLASYSPRLAWLERLKIRRIKGQMLHAAQNGQIFHLWWHPHQFGRHIEQSMKNLDEILEYYAVLKNTYGFESLTMEEMAAVAGRRSEEAAQQEAPSLYIVPPRFHPQAQ